MTRAAPGIAGDPLPGNGSSAPGPLPPFRLATGRCLACERPVEVGATFLVSRQGKDHAVLTRAEDYRGLCARCFLASTEGRDARLRASYCDLLAIRHDLGVPGGALFHHVSTAEPARQKKWAGFRLELFGVRVRPFPVSPRAPFISIEPPDGPTFTLVLYLRAVLMGGIPGAVLKLPWSPERGDESIEIAGWKQARTSELHRLLEGVELLHRYPRQIGRPRGSRLHDRADYEAAYLAVFDKLGRRPTQQEFVKHAPVDIRESTLRDNLQAWQVRWTEFQNQVEQSRRR